MSSADCATPARAGREPRALHTRSAAPRNAMTRRPATARVPRPATASARSLPSASPCTCHMHMHVPRAPRTYCMYPYVESDPTTELLMMRMLIDDRQPGTPTPVPPGRLNRMLGGTSWSRLGAGRHPDKVGRGSRLTGRNDPDPVKYLASSFSVTYCKSFLVKRPGGSDCNLHTPKCSPSAQGGCAIVSCICAFTCRCPVPPGPYFPAIPHTPFGSVSCTYATVQSPYCHTRDSLHSLHIT